jgi:hypothetical protein
MPRQLKISEDVHAMLTILKPFPSSSYDEVIRNLIEDAVPYLPRELGRIWELEKEDLGFATSEYHDLQQELFENFTVEAIRRKKEYAEERAEQAAIDKAEREQEEAADRYLEESRRKDEAEIDRAVEECARTHEKTCTPAPKKTVRAPKKRSVKK